MNNSYIRNDSLAGVFDRAAPTYNCVGMDYFNYYGNRLIESLPLFPGAELLDIACGKGAELFPASERVGETGKVFGIDFSANMIAEAQKSITNKGCSNIQVKQMDAENLTFRNDSFDFVSCGFAIQFFSNYRLALSEMLRVLKPGGKIGITSWKKREKPPIETRFVQKYTGVSEVPVYTVMKPEFGLAETLEQMFKEAGFHEIRITDENKRYYYRDAEHWWQDRWSHAGRAQLEIIEKMGPEVMENFKKDVLTELHEITDENGIFYDANVWYVFAEKSRH